MKHILNILFVLCTANSLAQSVGIGTTTPYAKLEISHSSASRPSIAIKDSSTSLAGWLQFGQVNSFRNMNLYGYASTDGSSASQRLYIGSDSIAAALTIKGDGNIGIGSVAPNSKLEIVHNSSSRPSLAVTDLSPIYGGWIQMGRQGSTKNMNIFGFSPTDGSSASQRLDIGSDSIAAALTIKGNGNIGVGTTSPQGKLEIRHNSSSTPTLVIKDEATPFAGWIQMRQELSNKAMNIFGYAPTDGHSASQKLTIGSDSINNILTVKGNGNVGLRNPNPTERLDVDGNLKFSGSLMPNGQNGLAGQVLQSNGAGATPTWVNGSIKTRLRYNFNGPANGQTHYTFTVPDGVYTVFAEAWGAGGRTAEFRAGGGGGGYISAFVAVVPGQIIDIYVGANATSPAPASASTGLSSYVQFATGRYIRALGGGGSTIVSGYNLVGTGGYGEYAGADIHPTIIRGDNGTFEEVTYNHNPSDDAFNFHRKYIGARGGNAGNTTNTGANGGTIYRIFFSATSAPATVALIPITNAVVPGGGGGGEFQALLGAPGLVYISY
jgi:hypothetical protein